MRKKLIAAGILLGTLIIKDVSAQQVGTYVQTSESFTTGSTLKLSGTPSTYTGIAERTSASTGSMYYTDIQLYYGGLKFRGGNSSAPGYNNGFSIYTDTTGNSLSLARTVSHTTTTLMAKVTESGFYLYKPFLNAFVSGTSSSGLSPKFYCPNYVVSSSTASGGVIFHTAGDTIEMHIDGNEIGSNAPLYLNYYSENNVFMCSSNGGKVSIGTTCVPDDGVMSVNGRMYTRRIVVDDDDVDWCDYVFNNDYALRPLGELEQYINEHKHLPEVPSTAEVTKNGINVVEMDAILLKKIEELSLYIVNQRKTLDSLQY